MSSRESLELRFSVEFVFEKEQMIFARLVEFPAPNFRMTDDAAIGGQAIHPVLSQPRALHEDGSPRYDLYAFRLRHWDNAPIVGQEVFLTGITSEN